MVRMMDKYERLIKEVEKLEVEEREYYKYPQDTLVINPLDGSAHFDLIVEKDFPVSIGNQATLVRFRGAANYMNPNETRTGMQIVMIQKEPQNPSRWIARNFIPLKIFKTNDKEKIGAYMMAIIMFRLQEEALVLTKQQLIDWKANPVGLCPWYLEDHEKIIAFMHSQGGSGIITPGGNRAQRRSKKKKGKHEDN